MRITFSQFLVAALSVSFVGILANADTIRLKNGSVIKGKVTTYNDREFTVYLDTGTASKRSTSRLVLAVEDVESIQFDGTDVPALGAVSTTQTKEPAVREAVTTAPPRPAPTTPTFTNTPTSTQSASQTEPSLSDKTVSVVAAADWTSTEIRIRKGQRVSISASGQIDLGGNRRVGPEGTALADPKKLIPNSPTGALIAVIGDDNDDFIAVGPQASFIAEREGILFLSVNETNLRDNSGSFAARVRVFAK